MRDPCRHHRLSACIAAACAVGSAVALPQDRGALRILANPDSASVVLDGARDAEPQKTPYLNESMIPGEHRIVLRPADPNRLPAEFSASIGAGATAVVRHDFEFRTQAAGMELLSVSPGRMRLESGAFLRRDLDDDPPGSPARAAAIPFSFRLGFPGALELHGALPLAGRSWGGLGPGDQLLGLKWTCVPIHSALDIAVSLGSAKEGNLGTRSDAVAFTAISDQVWKGFDLAANLGYALRFHSMRAPGVSTGDAASAKLRGGILVGDRLLPYLQAEGEWAAPDDSAGVQLGKSSFRLAAAPGLVWHAGNSLDFEIGAPMGLSLPGKSLSWGARISIGAGFGLGSAPGRRASGDAGSSLLSSSFPPSDRGAAHILFASREVTNAEYLAFCDRTGREHPPEPDFPGMPGYLSDPRYADYPVVGVSIADARAFAAWKGGRLPTAGEWLREVEGLPLDDDRIACGLDAPESVSSRAQGAGAYHLVGNVAEWVENDRGAASVAHMAGGFFGLPRERCRDRGRWIDVAAPSGGKFIGFRVATEVK